MKLTALIPAYNDAYTLQLCLASIGPHFDEILVLDDASTDETPNVCLTAARAHPHIRYVRHEGPQLGWVKARQRLLDLAGDAEHLFWLDADDVLCEYNAHLLRDVAQAPSPVCLLQLCEMWGDLHHTTQRLRHYDPCHVYTRRSAVEVRWEGCAMAKLAFSTPDSGVAVNRKSAIASRQSPSGPLFFHLKGVKPDRRLVERAYTRAWLRDPRRPDSLGQWPMRPIGPMCPISALSDAEVHALALKHLFSSRQDRPVLSYPSDASYRSYSVPGAAPEAPSAPQGARSSATGVHVASPGDVAPTRAPVRPAAILAALPGRFEIIYDAAGRPVDRIDHEVPVHADRPLVDQRADMPFKGTLKEDFEAFTSPLLRFRKGMELDENWLRVWPARGPAVGARLGVPDAVVCPERAGTAAYSAEATASAAKAGSRAPTFHF